MSPLPKPLGKDPIVDEPAQREAVHQAAEMKNDFVSLFTHGVDRIAEIQKRSIDVAVQHTSEIVETWKKVVQKMPGGSRIPMLEVATTAFERFADTQKHAIDLAAEQSRALVEAVNERTNVANKTTEAVVQLANQAVERSIAAQKKVVETAVAQTKAMLDATRQQMGTAGEPAGAAVNSFQRGVDAIVEAQKEMLDLVAK